MADKKINNLGIEGLDIEAPKESCNDSKCPFHGDVKLRGRVFTGMVVSAKAQRTIKVRWDRMQYIPKYERYEKKFTKIAAHNPDCIKAVEGDMVTIVETRPLSKTKNFVVVKKFKAALKIVGEDMSKKEAKKEDKTSKKDDKKQKSKKKGDE